jgi:hypothetical protein
MITPLHRRPVRLAAPIAEGLACTSTAHHGRKFAKAARNRFELGQQWPENPEKAGLFAI